jgi:protein-tyrosine phosphatase
MNHLIQQQNLEGLIECDSAGTSSYHIGSPPDSRIIVTAQRRGIRMQGSARQFKRHDFDRFDLILAMDRDNYHNILSLDPHQQFDDRVYLICEFCRRHNLREVPDPYYGGVEGFDRVLDLLTDACEGLLQYLLDQRFVAKLNKD